MQISAAEDVVISAEDFLEGFASRFRDKRLLSKNFELRPIHPAPTNHLVTVHMEKFNGTGPELYLSRHQLPGEDRIRTFKVYDPEHIFFTDDGDFSLSDFEEGIDTDTVKVRKATGGTRTVGIYECRGNKVCFKQWPEVPGCEVAFYRMYYAAHSSQYRENLPIPASEVIIMNGEVFLVAEFMEGESLKSILTKVSANPEYANRYNFDLDRFQALVIFCLITAPEDCRPENILVRRIKGSNKDEFVFIDNERSFGEQITEFHDSGEGLIRTRMHCALFCFHEMLSKTINEDTFRRITSRQFAKDILQAAEELRAVSAYLKALSAKVQDGCHRKSSLSIPLGTCAISGMSQRLERLNLIAFDRNKGLADIIVAVSPEIAHIYELDRRCILLSPVPSILQLKPQRPKLVHELINVLECMLRIDAKRLFGPTPPSAYVPLSVYFGSPLISPTVSTVPVGFASTSLSSAERSTSGSLGGCSSASGLTHFASSGQTDRGALDGYHPQLDFLELSLIRALGRKLYPPPCA